MTAVTDTKSGDATQHSVLNSSFPVLLPQEPALFLSDAEFQAFAQRELAKVRHPGLKELKDEIDSIDSDQATAVSTSRPVSTTRTKRAASTEADNDRPQKAPFVAGLERHAAHLRTEEDLAAENKSLTQNSDVTNISSKDPIVDLFYDLSESTDGSKLKSLLEAAWKKDSLLTLKIIFNARSIHLGKSNKVASYKAFGWLAENHPETFLANLQWLVRPVIAKKAQEKKEDTTRTDADDDFDMIETEDSDPTKAHDVKHGVSHGYWKDLLNLVVFAANDQLRFDGDPASLLTQQPDNSGEGKRMRNWDPETAKEARRAKVKAQNDRVQDKLRNDPLYRVLHLTVARLFAAQLKEDKAFLDSGKKSDLKKLSLAAKWAPTFSEFHDKQTFILSSIAEMLFPGPDATDRELYLRQAREHFRRQYSSPLRKALNIVERDIAANTFDNIKYERVPSLAMDRYTKLFMKKDYDHFAGYVKSVAKGTLKISGATLLPSTLVSKARQINNSDAAWGSKRIKDIKANAESEILRGVIDGQWNTLVQRVRDSGTLQSSIAVCDVSGSMGWPQFKDQSCPMDSAIGLSLLISEATAAPFGGGFITFSENPTYISMGGDNDTRGLVEKVQDMERADWGMNTNFVSVFEDIILPMAIKNELKQEDMVKQVFVFSDMQFDSAMPTDRWTSSFERIKKKFAQAGYEMPRMIFWNLAHTSTDKPTTMDDSNTALVSGYSQGMLKAFLETGAFDDEEEVVEEDVEEVEEDAGDGEGMTVVRKEAKKIDPLTVVKKAVDHKAYSMLEVVD